MSYYNDLKQQAYKLTDEIANKNLSLVINDLKDLKVRFVL